MKTTIYKIGIFSGLVVFTIACSVKKDTFLSRNSHAVSTEFNVLYNGELALQAGINDLKTNYNDDFWQTLPIERMQITSETLLPGQTRNPNFERSETKAIKAIQKHSMNIGGTEKNPQIDEAHLMLGKARYYDQRFIPALEAFNYILYKYPSSDKIYEAKVWREKTNVRLENDELAIFNLKRLLKDIKFKDQIVADANAILAQAYLNIEVKDTAIAHIKVAREFTKDKEEKARYNFILGQLYEQLGYQDSAYAAYQSVIDMKRSSPRRYVIQAHARQAAQFDVTKGDTIAFMEKYTKLLEDRENRPFLDVLNHQVALFYEKNKLPENSKKYYNASLKKRTDDKYLVASNYRNMADIYFDDAKYSQAFSYYDSTLVQLNPRTREFNAIKKKKDNLVDVIKYEGIANENDSILSLVAMNDGARTAYFEDYIAKLKIADDLRKKQKEKMASQQGSISMNSDDAVSANSDVTLRSARMKSKESSLDAMVGVDSNNSTAPPKASAPTAFYFYNPTTVAFGKNEFRKLWGTRKYAENWKFSSSRFASMSDDAVADSDTLDEEGKKIDKDFVDVKYTVPFYTSQIPTDPEIIATLVKDRNFAYYNLGVIYKDKFKEYKLASDKLENLLEMNPEERLILPSMYYLYKIYEITGSPKMVAMKQRIMNEYPESRYAQILSNVNAEDIAAMSPEAAYKKLYIKYEAGQYKQVLVELEEAIDQYTGEEIVSKFELLKAHTIGKIKGLTAYKPALNFVALTYPNSDEGKQAEAILRGDYLKLEKMSYNANPDNSWRILYAAKDSIDSNTKKLQAKIAKFLKDRPISNIKGSFDMFTETDNFIVVHGFKSQAAAEGMASVLAEFKEYKVTEKPIILSGHNYQVLQMKKDLPEFLSTELKEMPIEPTANIPAPAAPKSAIPPGTVGLKPPTDLKSADKPSKPGSAPQIQNPTKPGTPNTASQGQNSQKDKKRDKE